MKTFFLALCAIFVIPSLPAFAGENSIDEEHRQSVLLIAGYDGTIRAVSDVTPVNVDKGGIGDGIIDLRDVAELGVGAAFPPRLASYVSFTDLAVGGDGMIVASDITNKYLVLQDLFERRDKQTWLLALREEAWSVLVRGETVVYGMRYAPPGHAPYVIGYLEQDRTQSNFLINRVVASGDKSFPTACTALESRVDGSVLCLDTPIGGPPRAGRLWLIPPDIRNPKGLGDPVMVYESPRLVSVTVNEDNQVFVALKETEREGAKILRLTVDLRSRSVVGEPELIARGDLLNFDSEMANAMIAHEGNLYLGVDFFSNENFLQKAIVKVDPLTGDQSIYVTADVVATSNPFALAWWP